LQPSKLSVGLCENLQRVIYGMEISPAYCAVVLDRMQTAFPALEIKRAA